MSKMISYNKQFNRKIINMRIKCNADDKHLYKAFIHG